MWNNWWLLQKRLFFAVLGRSSILCIWLKPPFDFFFLRLAPDYLCRLLCGDWLSCIFNTLIDGICLDLACVLQYGLTTNRGGYFVDLVHSGSRTWLKRQVDEQSKYLYCGYLEILHLAWLCNWLRQQSCKFSIICSFSRIGV